MSRETKRQENSLSGTIGHIHTRSRWRGWCLAGNHAEEIARVLMATHPRVSRPGSVQNPPRAGTSLFQQGAEGDTTRALLAVEVPFASPGSVDLDFLALSFFGVVRPMQSVPPPFMSRPLRAFVIAKNPGIGGWPGASMKSWLPVCNG